MTGKSGSIASYSAEELAAKRRAGEDLTDRVMSHDEAMRRRAADAEAPQPDDSWRDSIIVGLPEPKKQMTLRLDADVVRWFQGQGKGYQTLMNAVLKGYVEHQSRKARGESR